MVKEILGRRFSIDDRFIPDYQKLGEVVQIFRSQGYKIAMTQGTWDMFHPGHILYLVRAKEDEEADILITVVDTDCLTRVRKGNRRPFDVLQERVIGATGQRAVDIVTLKYKEDHPHKVIEVVRPDILIVSQRVEDIKSSDLEAFQGLSGKLISLESQASVSTTAKLRRVRKEGAEILAGKIKELVGGLVHEYLEGMSEDEITAQLAGENETTEADELKSVTDFIQEWNRRRNGHD